MDVDLLLVILSATVAFGLIYLVDRFWFAARRKANQGKLPILVDYAHSFFPVLLFVLVLRSFFGQIYHVPSQSLEPTVMPGDLIGVSMFSYGLRLPVWRKKILKVAEPKRGDILLFHWPVDSHFNFVKRVVGVPGDHISYTNKVFTINGHQATQHFLNTSTDSNGGPVHWGVNVFEEDLLGVKHKIYVRPDVPAQNFKDLVVPKGHYFMVGDNRDNSDDSRMWGFISEADIIGKGKFVLLNWNSKAHWFGKGRFGLPL